MRLIGQRKTRRGNGGDDDLIIRTELVGGVGKYGRLLGWLYIGTDELSLNEMMITEGYFGHMMVVQNKRTLKNSKKFVVRLEHWYECLFLYTNHFFFLDQPAMAEGDLEMFEEICEVTGEVKRGFRLRDIKTQTLLPSFFIITLGAKGLFEPLLTFLGQLFA